MREDELEKEMQGADEYAHRYKRLNLLVQRRLDTTIKTKDCDNSSQRGNSGCPRSN